MVLSFFDAHLKSSTTAWHPPAPSAPAKNTYSVRAKQALRPLPTVASFAAAARANGGLAQSQAFLGRVLTSNPGYTIPFSELSAFAWSRSSAAARAGLFEVATTLYPTMPEAHSDLGDAYVAVGDTLRAAAAFERVLQLDSTRTYAKEQLRQLRPRSVP